MLDQTLLDMRSRCLSLAADLDRLDRADVSGESSLDFRLRAFAEALNVLASPAGSRLSRIQELLSDPTTEPRVSLDRKSALGAYDRWTEEAGA